MRSGQWLVRESLATGQQSLFTNHFHTPNMDRSLEERAIKRLGADDVRIMLDDVSASIARLRGED